MYLGVIVCELDLVNYKTAFFWWDTLRALSTGIRL